MLIVGYCMGIRSERRLCDEVHLNLAYRWFCRLGLDGQVPDHSTFSKTRHGRFRDSDLLRQLFEATVKRCIAERMVGGDGFAVDASLIRAEANRQRFHTGEEGLPPDQSSRAVEEYLAVLDDAAFGQQHGWCRRASPHSIRLRALPRPTVGRRSTATQPTISSTYRTPLLLMLKRARLCVRPK
jgi:IS5 family transposase